MDNCQRCGSSGKLREGYSIEWGPGKFCQHCFTGEEPRPDLRKYETGGSIVRICSYCGEEEGTEKVADPNLDLNTDIDWSDKKNYWMVCKSCEQAISLQRGLAMSVHMGDEIGEKMASRYNLKLSNLAIRTKKPIMAATLRKRPDGKGYETVSVEFTGEGDIEHDPDDFYSCGHDRDQGLKLDKMSDMPEELIRRLFSKNMKWGVRAYSLWYMTNAKKGKDVRLCFGCWVKSLPTGLRQSLVLRRMWIKRKIEHWQFGWLMWWSCKKLHINCKLWGWRGLATCEEHGFHAQSWRTGDCRLCAEEPVE